MVQHFDHSQPIYLQLVQRISWEIIRGERKKGEKLPSVREMAVDAGVNPNTVQRTYSELERKGITETKRGQGTFVSGDENTLVQLRKHLKDEQIDTFIHDMKEMGFTAEEMVTGLKENLQKETGGAHND